jgi:para-nitrobenzyl esterase
VVVTVNLRLNSLGWLNLPALKTGDPWEDSGNYGLLDILCALDWVRENIDAFGGDRENITASGYSSGARDLLCMLISPAFAGKFTKALTFSGGFTTTEPAFGEAVDAAAIAPLAVEDGMAPDLDAAAAWLRTAGQDVRDWLYSVSGERFGGLMAGAAIRMLVFPHLFADGALLPREGFDCLKAGKCFNVPMLCLSGGHEFDFPANNDPLFKNADFADPTVAAEYRFATKYGGYLFGYINAEQNAAAFSAVPGHAPVYAGRCLWGMDPAVTDDYAAMRMGGTHGLDLYLVMDIERAEYALSENVWRAENRPGRAALIDAYRQYIRAFLRTGDPNVPGQPRWDPWAGMGT